MGGIKLEVTCNSYLLSDYSYILNAKNLAPPFLSIFSGTKSMISKINVL